MKPRIRCYYFPCFDNWYYVDASGCIVRVDADDKFDRWEDLIKMFYVPFIGY